ncbi:thermonuclease family protein [Microbacterium sp. B19]|uniref:thermonuclease family protein n=1 Tax=Microbacterium sp. B19 TaxID=96765 RepID=UPI00034A8797|nr:thermonuclease family protein [Microbacterium sp. B19]
MWLWVILGILLAIVVLLLSPIFAVVFLAILITGIVALAKNSRTWLRFRSRKAAAWVTAVAAVGFLATAGITNAAVVNSPPKTPVALVASPVSAATPAASATPRPTPTPTPTQTPTPTPTPTPVQIVSVIDGDTIDTNIGKVRLIGIDAPESGSWGYDQATTELTSFLAPGGAVLVSVPGRDDKDQYGRLLRYVQVNGEDAGTHMLRSGWAIARYDGRDGYGSHPLQATYISVDDSAPMPAEPAPAPAEPAPAQPAPADPAPQPAQPEPAPADPAPANDPRFKTCKEAIANGYGPYQSGVDPEYDWYRDADHDGWDCER